MPIDLSVGLWMDDTHKTPWELGFTEIKDFALLSRAKRAVYIYRTARQFQDSNQITHLTADQLRLIDGLRQADARLRPAPPRRRTVVVRKRRAQGKW